MQTEMLARPDVPVGVLIPHAGDRLVFEDLRSIFARETYGLSDDWEWHTLTSAPDTAPPGWFKMVGAVAPMMKRKPRRDWGKMDRATERTFFVERAVFEAWRDARESRTGVCHQCSGHGRALQQLGMDGVIYRTCPRCGGSGKAPQTELFDATAPLNREVERG